MVITSEDPDLQTTAINSRLPKSHRTRNNKRSSSERQTVRETLEKDAIFPVFLYHALLARRGIWFTPRLIIAPHNTENSSLSFEQAILPVTTRLETKLNWLWLPH